MSKSDSSVVVALSELVRMEETRIDDERAQAAAREAETVRLRERAAEDLREAERLRADRALHAARVIEAEARIRLEADREQGKRIDLMRTELARVEAERSTLRASLEARVREQSEPPRARGWAMAFGLSSLVAASLAGLLVMNAQQTRTVIVEAPRAVVVPPAEVEPAIEVAAAEPVIEPVTEPTTAPAAAATGRGGHQVREHRERTPTAETDVGDDLGLGTDDGSDDVLSPEILHHAEHETRGARR